ncbi:MAG: hypothetical protein IRZ16_09300 [Myxococcaceae bacterium]|nr:hypothetical protein [Myxococcaceae bacterium]
MKVGSDSAAVTPAAASVTVSNTALDLLTDFVQQTQAELGFDPLGGPQPEQIQQQQEVQKQQREDAQERQEQVARQLDQAIREADRRADQPLRNLLTKLKEAVLAGPPETPGEEKALKELLNPGMLLQQQDGFGEQKASLPPAVKQAVEYLRYVLENPIPPPSSDLEVLDELAAQKLAQANEAGAPAEATPEHVDPRDQKVREFVARYFSEAFEDAPRPALDKPLPQTPQEKLAQLPKDARPDTPAFARLTPEEQKFVLTADAREIAAYNQLPKDQKSVFRELKPHERREFLKLSPDEKQFVQQLEPEARSHYLNLHPDGRAELRQKSPEQRAAIFAEVKQQQAEVKKQPPEKVAQTLGKELLSQLGLRPEKKPQLLEKARALAYNYLTASGGDLAQAQMGTLKALIQQPEVQRALEKDVAAALKAEMAPAGSNETQEAAASNEPARLKDELRVGDQRDEQQSDLQHDQKQEQKAEQRPFFRLQQGVNYTQHFQKIRHVLLPEFAMKLVQPGVTRDQIVEGMKKAVIVSAEFAQSHPPRSASARYQQIRRGFAARQLFG